jgi:hypothetical protein
MNDRFGTTVPLVCETGIGAKQTSPRGPAAGEPIFSSQQQPETDRPVCHRCWFGDRCGDGSFVQRVRQPSAERSRLHLVVQPTKTPSVSIAVARVVGHSAVFAACEGFSSFGRNARHLASHTRGSPPIRPRPLFGARTTRPLVGLIWPKDGCASIARDATAAARLSSPGLKPIARTPRNSHRRHPPLRSGLRGVLRRSPPAFRSPSRPRRSRARNSQGEVTGSGAI